MNIVIASDHAGFEFKNSIIKAMQASGLTLEDGGTFTASSCDYPDYAFLASERVAKGEFNFAILLCGSGIGVAIAANKVKGIRCAVGYDDQATILARKDNNANVIAFGARLMPIEAIIRRIKLFIATPYDGGRHQKRVDLIATYEKKVYR